MEGNECYKFATIVRFVEKTNAVPIELIMDIGANVGAVSLEMSRYFPLAQIFGFEPVEEWFRLAVINTKVNSNISIEQAAISAFDDVQLHKALPNSGPGWQGGSFVGRPGKFDAQRYELSGAPLRIYSFDAIVARVLAETGRESVDIVKSDCEGSEIEFLGNADLATLKRCRYIVGEYHEIQPFYEMCEAKLFYTHCVSLVGNKSQGAFFAELKSASPSILQKRLTSPRLYPQLADIPLRWHIFNQEYIGKGEELAHGYLPET